MVVIIVSLCTENELQLTGKHCNRFIIVYETYEGLWATRVLTLNDSAASVIFKLEWIEPIVLASLVTQLQHHAMIEMHY